MSIKEIQFNAEEHIYSLGGKLIPSVTQILNETAIITPYNWSEFARLRGTYVHEAIHLHHNGGVERDSIDKTIQPYFSAYLGFIEQADVEIIETEKMIYHPTYGYAGRLDLLAVLNGVLSVIDIKTGGLPGWTALQTAAYKAGCTDEKPIDRYGLQLTENGKWSLYRYVGKRDALVFFSAATLINWKLGRL